MAGVGEILEDAVRCHQLGELKRAEQLYQHVLSSEPTNLVALHSLGMLSYQTGDLVTAFEMLKKAISANEQVPQFHNTIGIVLEAMERYDEAISAYREAISIKPDYADAYHNMGIALQSQGNFNQAIEVCKKAVLLAPDFAKAYNTMGFSLEKQKRYAEAIESYRQAIGLMPDFAEAYNHLGVVLNEQQQWKEAVENFRKALQIAPEYAEAYSNLGVVLKALDRPLEAIENYQHALKLDTNYLDAYYNLANAFRDEGRCADAIENYEHALDIEPDCAKVHWNLSLTLLLSGNYRQGWEEYKWRRKAGIETIADFSNCQKPRWDGSPFDGKRLFIHYEQGLGDIIQFCRYLPMVKHRGGTVIFEVPASMLCLLKDFAGIDELVEQSDNNDKKVDFDIYASLLDFPHIFQTTVDTVVNSVPYLFAEPEKTEKWRKKITGQDFKVGIVWAGSPTHGHDGYRSCSLKYFAPLSQIDGVQLYGLQKGDAAGQMAQLAEKVQIVNISKDFADFTDTAAAIENMDLVISVDTSVLHLAAAMGKQVWALLAYSPEWRWMLNKRNSPWYPTMRLFRQKKLKDWQGLFEQVTEELQKTVKAKNDSNHSPSL